MDDKPIKVLVVGDDPVLNELEKVLAMIGDTTSSKDIGDTTSRCLYDNSDCDSKRHDAVVEKRFTKDGWVETKEVLCGHHYDREIVKGGFVPRAVHSKIGRNKPCPCASGKKYKKCCGR